MVLRLWRRWNRLHFRHKVQILVIVAPPMAFRFLVHEELSLWAEALAYVGWAILAAQVIAYMVEKDSRELIESLKQHIKPLAVELDDQKEESKRRMTGLEAQFRQVDQVMRAAFRESGIDLPPVRVQLSALAVSGPSSSTAELRIRCRRWYKRLWRWTLGYARKFFKLVWG